MKKIYLLSLLTFFVVAAFAQEKSDSLAYQLQRKKINQMLAIRKQKFGKYDQSLSKHTGIFGLQTKKDIRRSNDILMDIVQTDNNIYKELKILLDYRAFQQTQVQTQSQEVQKSNLAFMNTINRFRKQNEGLKAQLDQQTARYDTAKRWYIIIILLMLTSILILIFRKRRPKA
ncbi:hypothetical protein [Mucilaginibacter segetis]|uniref:Uncharacterized protein n=1 Tax=Mucilaginibacter segetis TaxID=2793071 RepID=A0A934UMY2_9SPHI|nr:hypothetical protein [Mucilaginibacter segetis]MBK0379495.1 hypothetical protein [Mucilaginibacter segetis]